MANIDVYNQNGDKVGKTELSDYVFSEKINQALLHRAVVAQNANKRQGNAHAKDRSEVRGGGKKPWRQKGTGRARHGSIRSPIWKGGGAAFGPRSERDFLVKINKKERQAALRMALGSKLHDQQLVVVDAVTLQNNKTKEMSQIFDSLSKKMKGYKDAKNKKDSVLFVIPGKRTDNGMMQASNNLSFIGSIRADSLNVVEVLKYKYIVILQDALTVMEKTYGRA